MGSPPADRDRFTRDQALALVMYADEHDLSRAQCHELVEELYQELLDAAGNRSYARDE